VQLDSEGNLFIADTGNDVIRVVWASNGTISTFAGIQGAGSPAYSGDGGPATSARLNYPAAVQVTETSVYIMDTGNSAIRAVSRATGIITTVVGNGTAGYAGDGGPASLALLAYPNGSFVDYAGNMFIADTGNNVVRKVSPSGIITTVAGNGSAAFCGDFGIATQACLNSPTSVYVDADNNLHIADYGNDRIRVVADGLIVTVAGGGSVDGEHGAATSAELSGPTDLHVDSYGNLYIAEVWSDRIRVVVSSDVGIPCAPGYSCQFGTPQPCSDPTYYCPVNALAPTRTSYGYFATVADSSVGTMIQQSGCPAGSFCVNGTKLSCPPGTYGKAAFQSDISSCGPCSPGTYNALLAQTSSAACLSCPTGTYSSQSGAPFCQLCPPNTYGVVAGQPSNASCLPCSEGTVAFAGATSCVSTLGVIASSPQETTFDIAPIAFSDDLPPEQLALLQMSWAVPIVVVSLLPLLALLIGRNCAGPHYLVRRLERWFLSIDKFGLAHDVGEGQAPIQRVTVLGGSVTVVAIGTVLAVAVALVIQYFKANSIVQESVLPAPLPTLQKLADLPLYTLTSPSGLAPTLQSGMQLQLITMGPLCSLLTLASEGLLAGQFVLNTNVSTAGGRIVHTIDCQSCMFGPLSGLTLALDPSCQSLQLSMFAVGVLDAMTAMSIQLGGLGNGSFLSTASLVASPQLVVQNNARSNVVSRGVAVTFQSYSPQYATAPASVSISVSLAIALEYVNINIVPVNSALQLASSIIALSGLFGAFAMAISPTENKILPWVKKVTSMGSGLPQTDKNTRASDWGMPVVPNPLGPASRTGPTRRTTAARGSTLTPSPQDISMVELNRDVGGAR
jgi:hypothetical protein